MHDANLGSLMWVVISFSKHMHRELHPFWLTREELLFEVTCLVNSSILVRMPRSHSRSDFSELHGENLNRFHQDRNELLVLNRDLSEIGVQIKARLFTFARAKRMLPLKKYFIYLT